MIPPTSLLLHYKRETQEGAREMQRQVLRENLLHPEVEEVDHREVELLLQVVHILVT